MSSCSFHYSKEAIINQLYGVRFNNDCQIVYSQFPDSTEIDNIKAIAGVDKVETYSYYSAEVSFNGKAESISINGVPENNSLLKIPNETDGIIGNIEGFVLEKHTAKNLDVKVGDYVSLDGKSTLVTALSNQFI